MNGSAANYMISAFQRQKINAGSCYVEIRLVIDTIMFSVIVGSKLSAVDLLNTVLLRQSDNMVLYYT